MGTGRPLSPRTKIPWSAPLSLSKPMHDLESIAAAAMELEALPESSIRLTSIMSSDDWLIGDVVHTIQHDQALTGRLLKLANSAAVGGSRAVESVGDAVMRVGTGPVLSLAVASAVRDSMTERLASFDEAEGSLWRHSVAAALIVQNAGKHCDVLPPPECFVAALLHDIGFLALDRWLGAMQCPRERRQAKGAIETGEHGVLAGMIAAGWQLPTAVQEAIVHHHDPLEAPSERGRYLAHFVCLADCGARVIGAEFSPEPSRLGRETAEALGLTRARFDELCAESEAGLAEILELYS